MFGLYDPMAFPRDTQVTWGILVKLNVRVFLLLQGTSHFLQLNCVSFLRREKIITFDCIFLNLLRQRYLESVKIVPVQVTEVINKKAFQ